MLEPGDIVEIYSPTTGYKKYHVCLGKNAYGTHCFLYLNSSGGFDGNLEFPCCRFPMIPSSDTGLTVLSLSDVAHVNDRQLQLYKAKKLGEISKDVAAEMLEHARAVKTLPRPLKEFVIARLETIIDA